jgi:hypothetical protein
VQAEELYHLVYHEPFEPFRIHLQDGRTFEVRYQHLAKVGKTFFLLGIPSPDDPEPYYYDRLEIFDLPYIKRAEKLGPTSNSGVR